MSSVTNPVQNIHRYSIERMRLKTEDNCYVHNLLFADDQIVITGRVDDANYIGRQMEEVYEK
jgi:hypothetical protein